MLPELTAREVHGCIIAELRGEFDVGSVAALEQFLREVLARQTPVIILDLARTLFADVATMRVILNAEQEASSQGRRLVLAAPQPAVARLLEITCLDWHFVIFPTADEATAQECTTEETVSTDAADLPAARG